MVSNARGRKKRPAETLKHRTDFNNIRSNGRSVSPNSWLLLRLSTNKLGRLRVGFTFPRYVGPAVVRNRLRRWCKEFFREFQSQVEFPEGLDVNVILRKRDKGFYNDIEHAEVDRLLTKAMAVVRRPHA